MALRGLPSSGSSLEVLGARLADIALEQQQVTSRLEAGFASVRDRFRALDRGLATAHTQQELQSMAATALSVSSVDLSRADRSKMLKELESKGKMVMSRLDGLQANKPCEDDGASHGFVPATPDLPPAALAAAGAGAVNGVVSALERRIAQLEAGGSRIAQAPAAGAQRSPSTPAFAQQADPTWSRRLEDIESALQAQMSALQISLERRVESAESELRAMATSGTEQRRRDFDTFCMELRRELGTMNLGSGIGTPRGDLPQSDASIAMGVEDPQARLQMLGSRIAMNKIELTARVAMIEDVVTRAQVATVAPRLKRAERLLEKILHAQGMPGEALELSSPGSSPPPITVFSSRNASREAVQSV